MLQEEEDGDDDDDGTALEAVPAVPLFAGVVLVVDMAYRYYLLHVQVLTV
jgi:hypothetical protein